MHITKHEIIIIVVIAVLSVLMGTTVSKALSEENIKAVIVEIKSYKTYADTVSIGGEHE